MVVAPSLKTGFHPKLINLPGRKPRSNRQRTAHPHVRANSSNKSDKNTKGSEDQASNVTLKVVPALLNEQSGVGVIATVGVIAAARLAQASFDGVAAVVEKDLKPALENPENLENWKRNLSNAVQDAKSNASKSFKQVGENFNEAMADFKANTDAANQEMAKEVELGAANWEKTTAAITSTPNDAVTSNDKDMVAVLTEVEDKGTEILKTVGKEIKDLTNRKESLQTGWLSKAIGQDTSNINTISAPANVPASVPIPVPAAQVVEEAPAAAVSQTSTKSEAEESPPPPIAPPTVVATIIPATEIKTNLDSSLDAVTKGGRHVSMLSAPMGVSNKSKPATAASASAGSALGFSKSSPSSSAGSGSSSSSGSSPGASSGGSSGSISGKAGLDALKAAAGAGSVATAATVGGENGGSDGGNFGGGGGGGGGGVVVVVAVVMVFRLAVTAVIMMAIRIIYISFYWLWLWLVLDITSRSSNPRRSLLLLKNKERLSFYSDNDDDDKLSFFSIYLVSLC